MVFKFRAKSIKDKQWIYGYYVAYTSSLGINHYIQTNSERIEVIENTICQFINELDDNGNELYNGDIVCTEFIKHNEPNLKLIQYIEYRDACYHVKSKNADDKDYDYTFKYTELYSVYKIEKIGNIFDDETLLEVRNERN